MGTAQDELLDELRSLAGRSAEILKRLACSGTAAPQVVCTHAPSYGYYARSVLAGRARVGHYFSSDLFADPAFDILLDLFATAAEEREADIGSVSAAARVPATIALRWLDLLVDRGVAVRIGGHPDGTDSFRLSAQAHERMQAYLEEISSIPLRRD